MTDEYAVLGMRVLGFYSHATTLQVLIVYANLADCRSSLAPKVVSFVFWDDKYQSTIATLTSITYMEFYAHAGPATHMAMSYGGGKGYFLSPM